MRLMLINYELPPIGGGGGHATLRLAEEFLRLGHQVSVLTSASGHGARDELRPVEGATGALHIRRVPCYRPFADRCPPHHMATFVASALVLAPRFARQIKPDLVLAFFGIPCGPVALRIKRLLGTRYVLSLRGTDVPRPELGHQRFLEALTRPVLRCAWRGADAIVAVGEGLRSAALAIEPGLDIEVIPNGVDVERFGSPGREPRTAGPLRLLFVGRLREFKGLQFVVAALGARPADAPAVRLDVVGDGPYRPEVERQTARLGLDAAVTFHGWLAPERVPERYAAADALVLPSRVEGSPNVVLEAMASGLPVITSNAPGCRDMIHHGENGLLVDVGDATGWRQAIDQLCGEPGLRRRLGRAGRVTAEAHSWRGVARRHLEVFRQVLRSPAGC